MRVHVPVTIEGALGILEEEPDATVLAGGSDLMVSVNLRHERPPVVVSLRRLDELREMRSDWIGAGVTFRSLERSPHRALAQLARTVGSPQIRNVATIGGNLGTASPAGDSLPFLLAADARVHLRSRSAGERVVPIDDFLLGPKQTDRRPGELIVGVSLHASAGDRQAFAKLGPRSAMVIALASVCVLRGATGWRVAVGSVAPTAIRIAEAEHVLDERGSEDPDMDEIRDAVARTVRPIDDHRSTAAYRRQAVAVLAGRCVERCLAG